MAESLITWLQATAVSRAIVSATWIWPAAEALHFIGLALVLGIAGFFDVRLMGWFRHVPVGAAHALIPWAVGGFLINLVTGAIFFIGHPEQYVHNRAWWFKVGFLAVAGLNAVVFERVLSARVLPLGAGADTPLAAKAIGALSLIAWLGVLYWGRMLPFIGDAY